jgi:hypothetical protein
VERTRLFIYLQSLKPIELNRLVKFIGSPVFNTNEELLKLLAFVVPYFKTGNAAELTREVAWKHLKGRKTYKDLEFRRLTSDLVIKIESFLAFEQYKKNPLNEMNYLMTALNEKKLTEPFSSASKYSRNLLAIDKMRDADYYFDSFRIETAYSVHLESMNQRSAEKNLFQAMQALDAFYLINKLRSCAAVLHYKSVTKFDGEFALLPELLQHLEQHDYAAYPAITIYHRIIQTLMEPENENYFLQLGAMLLKNYMRFPHSMARDMYAFALNYCVRMINRGRTEYLGKALNLYKDMAAAGLLAHEGKLSQFDYKNVVTTALRVKDFAFAEQFIYDYKGSLKAEERDNAFSFNLARLHFYRKDYKQAMRLLQTIEYDDVFYQLDAKTTLLKCYYELGEYSLLMSLKDSFVKLLRRKKTISEQHRVNYSNFIRFTTKLYRLDTRDKKKVTELGTDIGATEHVADKTWLVEKVGELAG